MAFKDKAQTIKYNNDFNKTAYDRINLMVPKGDKDTIAVHAATRGESVNSFIKRAIAETIARDNTSD